MDAWETLVTGSTITDGDAWEHLLAQDGESRTIILAAGLDGALAAAELPATITDQALSGTVVVQALTATITADSLSAEILDTALNSDVTAVELAGEV